MILRPKDIVVISENIDHDVGYKGQVGLIYKKVNIKEPYYYVMAYDKRAKRFWVCGFDEKDLRYCDHNIKELKTAYKDWVKSNDCW